MPLFSRSVRLVFFSLLLTGLSPLLWAASAGKQSVVLLKAKNYDALERLYDEVSAGPFKIDEDPELLKYFDAFAPKRSETDEVWLARLAQIETWREAKPESRAAILAQATFYDAYGFKARGGDWAKNVTPEGWRLFYERRKQAGEILENASARLEGELHYHYEIAHLHSADRETIGITRRHLDIVTERAPGYWPGYDLMSTYLQVRWGADPTELPDHAKKSADSLGGADGDILYARLMDYAAFSEGDEVGPLYQPDAARIWRGYEAALQRAGNNRSQHQRLKAGYAHTAARLGEWKRARAQLLSLGQTHHFSYWGDEDGYRADLEKSGARGEIAEAALLEQKGQWDLAEACYLSFEPDRTQNTWLADFYLRHGRAADYARSAYAYPLDRPVAALSLDDAAELSRIYAMLGDFGRARAAATQFDQARGHNLTGKTALYHAALYTGDTGGVQRAREAIVKLKTNRPSYQLAQAVLRGEKTMTGPGAATPDWNDPYVFQGITVIALFYYETGKREEAQALLADSAGRCGAIGEREWMNALRFHPPAAPTLAAPAMAR